jgi:hypothetical protein
MISSVSLLICSIYPEVEWNFAPKLVTSTFDPLSKFCAIIKFEVLGQAFYRSLISK